MSNLIMRIKGYDGPVKQAGLDVLQQLRFTACVYGIFTGFLFRFSKLCAYIESKSASTE